MNVAREAGVTLVFVALLAGCTGRAKPVPRAASKAAAVAVAPPLAARVPAATDFFVTAPSAQWLSALVGYEALRDGQAAALLADGRLSSKEQLGHDLYDLSSWPALGLDPAGPVGFAVIDSALGTHAWLVTVADQAAVMTALTALAKKIDLRHDTLNVGRTYVLSSPFGVAFVVAPAWLAFVVSTGEANGVGPAALALAKLVPEQALSQSPDFAPVWGSLPARPGIIVVGRPRGLTLAAQAELVSLERVRVAFDEAYAFERDRIERGPAPARSALLAAAETALAERKRVLEDWAASLTAQLTFHRAFTDHVSSLGVHLDFAWPTVSLVGTARFVPGSLPATLLRTGPGIVEQAFTVPGPLGLAFGVSMDPASAVTVAELMLDLVGLDKKVRSGFGRSLRQLAVEVLDGRVTASVALPDPFSAPQAFLPTELRVAVGLSPGNAWNGLWETLLLLPPTRKKVSRSSDGFVFNWDRDYAVTTKNGWGVLTSAGSSGPVAGTPASERKSLVDMAQRNVPEAVAAVAFVDFRVVALGLFTNLVAYTIAPAFPMTADAAASAEGRAIVKADENLRLSLGKWRALAVVAAERVGRSFGRMVLWAEPTAFGASFGGKAEFGGDSLAHVAQDTWRTTAELVHFGETVVFEARNAHADALRAFDARTAPKPQKPDRKTPARPR